MAPLLRRPAPRRREPEEHRRARAALLQAHIWPQLQAGKTVIVAAHGNSLRALVMQLDALTREQVLALNLATGVPLVYRLNADGTTAEKRELAA